MFSKSARVLACTRTSSLRVCVNNTPLDSLHCAHPLICWWPLSFPASYFLYRFQGVASINNSMINICIQFFSMDIYFHFPLDWNRGVQCLFCMANFCLMFDKTAGTVSQSSHIRRHFPPALHKGSNFSPFQPRLVIICVMILFLMRVKRSLPTVLICTWLMNNDMEHFLMCHPLCLLQCLAHFVNLPLRICLSALERKKEVGGKREREGEREKHPSVEKAAQDNIQPTEPPGQGHGAHFKNCVLCFLLLNYKSFLYFFDTSLSAPM